MLKFSVLRYFVELANRSSYVVVVVLLEVLQGSLLGELVKCYGYLAVLLYHMQVVHGVASFI